MIEHCHCQKINPADWHEKTFTWGKPRFFYRVTTRMAFHQPFSYHEDIALALAKARSEGHIINENALILPKSGLFKGEILIEIQPQDPTKHCGDSSIPTRGTFLFSSKPTP